MKEYTEEIYKLVIRSRHLGYEVERVARCMNGLRNSIQEEINLIKM